MQKENPKQLSTMFIEVESIEDYTDKVNDLGAKVVKDKQEISEGLLCSFRRSSRKYVWCLAEENSCLQILCYIVLTYR
jgi:predicted enzyme related to lactoylglutathione lyase